MKQKINFQMTLSLPQLMWLADSRYGKNRMAFLVSMLRMTAMAGYESVVNNIRAPVHVGQVERSEVQLAADWQCDRKTVARVIQTMNKLGIITTEKSNRTSVHTVRIVAAWVVDNVRIRNPNFRPDYDWQCLQKGSLADAVRDVTFGQPRDHNTRPTKGNILSGSSLGSNGNDVVLPTVEGLEMADEQSENPEPIYNNVSASDSDPRASPRDERQAKSPSE